MNRSTLRHVALAVVIGINFTIFGCGDEEEMMDVIQETSITTSDGRKVAILEGNITGERTLMADNDYLLRGAVFV